MKNIEIKQAAGPTFGKQWRNEGWRGGNKEMQYRVGAAVRCIRITKGILCRFIARASDG